MNTEVKVICSRCGKQFKAAGLSVHITRKHAYDMWKEQQERKANR